MTEATESLPSVSLLAAGKCPGWRRGYGAGGKYEADVSNGRYSCGRKATRGDLCGLHDNVRKRDEQEEARRAARRDLRRQKEAEQSEALNLAMMLGEYASASGCTVAFDAEDGIVWMTRDAAAVLLTWLQRQASKR